MMKRIIEGQMAAWIEQIEAWEDIEKFFKGHAMLALAAAYDEEIGGMD
jgi:hypothetical protein